MPDETWFFPLAKPGVHAVLRDVVPPAISGWREARRVRPGSRRTIASGVTPPHWEIIAVGLEDRGSGLDAATIRAWLNGEPLVVEPDLPRDRLLVELPDDLEPGDHVLGLEVADLAGNFTARSLPLRCR
jgi:hypothetical protein